MVTYNDLKNALAEGVTVFQYLKKDGTIREARGTTNLEIIKAEGYAFKGSQRPAPEGVTVYWDLDAHGWRSFVTANLL